MSVYLTLSNNFLDGSWDGNLLPIDGLGTEGIGSVMQFHILLRFFSDYYGVFFTYPGSSNFSHYSYTHQTQDEYLKSIDKFFNFPNIKHQWEEVYNILDLDDHLFYLIESNKNNDKIVLINFWKSHGHLRSICQQKCSEIFIKDRVDRIRSSLVFEGKKYFDENVNISLHIRVENPCDIESEIHSSYRELYAYNKDFYRYENLLKYLQEKYKNKKATLHIHSQGFKENFEEFLQFRTDDFDIQVHLDDHPVSDLYHMSNSDLLITSNSSFSWISSLLNSNEKIVRDNQFNSIHFAHNVIKSNYDYTEFL